MSAKAVIQVIGFLLVLSSAVYFAWRIFVDEPAKQAEVDKAWEEYDQAKLEADQARADLNREINNVIAQANNQQ